MRQIYPAPGPEVPLGEPGGEPAPRAAAELLAGLYAYPPGVRPDRPWVRANMIASTDGAAELDGVTSGLGGPADRLLFQVQRTLADVILVGAGTVRAEKYRPARPMPELAELRWGRPPAPPIAVLTARLDLDPDSPLLARAADGVRTIVLTTEAAPADRRAAVARHAEVIVAGADRVDASQAISALAGLGHARILTEGGPGLLAQIAGAGRLDELCLTISPVLAGGAARRILASLSPPGLPAGERPGGRLPGSGQSSGFPEYLRLAHVLCDGAFLFTRYVRQSD
ncbi:MAG: pyrimidine reductase family protein [Streptosporangiaceae bacterium]